MSFEEDFENGFETTRMMPAMVMKTPSMMARIIQNFVFPFVLCFFILTTPS